MIITLCRRGLLKIYASFCELNISFCKTLTFRFADYIRITLREAKKGERLEINGLVYICSGEMDEQAFRRLSTSRQKSITIKGDRHFRKSQIQKIEGLEIY